MGALRLLLAVSVVIHHAGPLYGWTLTGGLPAVQTFFMISGFYIHMILSDKYAGPGALRTFYLNRFLRLFPAYWMVLAFTLLVSLLGWTALPGGSFLYFWKQWWPTLSWQAALFGIMTNLGIFFQDLAMFLKADPASGALQWTSHFVSEAQPIWLLLIVPQAWSLGIELLFYLVAPALFRSGPAVIAGIAACSFGLRLVLVAQGFNTDPWTARLFPTELVFFCVGALSNRFYLSRLKEAKLGPKLGRLILAVVLGSTLFFQYIPVFNYWHDTAWAYYTVVALSLPYLFKTTENSRWDRMVGDLSYPLYIGHFVVMRLIPHATNADPGDWTSEVLFWSLAFAAILLWASRPFERLRLRNAGALRSPRSRGGAPRDPGNKRALRRSKKLARAA